ncbi:Uncharacterised protein [Mycobacterium tuberculosis]|nr:Uncharacterised protein [Mycobacterium tuberculosis]CNM17146.1 Uncharacterised protein [Mycobacterium tuberculosis]CNU23355.1 Uncharacterised protein [Mycobacterium tuberculosis]COV21154.1 Uncharacterised protein [Mycobacterium tuberculosis]COW38257.1 Uncharacterised protein [Mycobacterium tuberculosis]
MGPSSTSLPSKNRAARSLMRAAWARLWVTMITVRRSASDRMNSSIFSVVVGSSAEVGSSSSNTSGFTASVRARHNNCC